MGVLRAYELDLYNGREHAIVDLRVVILGDKIDDLFQDAVQITHPKEMIVAGKFHKPW